VSLLTDDRARLRLALVSLICLAGFLAVALLVRAGVTDGLDRAALEALASFHGGPLDPVMVVISELGVADVLGFFTMIPAGLLWALGARRAAVFVGGAYFLSAIVTDVIKATVARPRPPVTYQIPLKMPETEDLLWAGLAIVLVVALWRTRWRWGVVLGAAVFAITIWYDPAPLSTPGLDSFPSGHALRSAVLIASLLIAMPWRPSRRVITALVVVLVAIGVSRVYLGEHHPTDVVAGWFAGITLAMALSLIPVLRAYEGTVRLDAPAATSPPGRM
jgi:membrane-associated phospholipid phosphatase